MNRALYVFWTGENPVSENRRRSLEAMANTGLPLVFVTAQNLPEYLPPARLHPAYPSLNLAHRADYLRCYFMHHHGGAYSDLKLNASSWLAAFEGLANDPEAWATGYRELRANAVADIYLSARRRRAGFVPSLRAQLQWRHLQLNYRKVIGNGAFIFKPGTPLTAAWWEALNQRLDELLPELERHPARHPKDQPGMRIDGEPSRYPVPWTYLLGDVLQPLALQHSARLRYDLPPPEFTNYA